MNQFFLLAFSFNSQKFTKIKLETMILTENMFRIGCIRPKIEFIRENFGANEESKSKRKTTKKMWSISFTMIKWICVDRIIHQRMDSLCTTFLLLEIIFFSCKHVPLLLDSLLLLFTNFYDFFLCIICFKNVQISNVDETESTKLLTKILLIIIMKKLKTRTSCSFKLSFRLWPDITLNQIIIFQRLIWAHRMETKTRERER